MQRNQIGPDQLAPRGGCKSSSKAQNSNKKSDPRVALFHGGKRAIIRRSLRPLQ